MRKKQNLACKEGITDGEYNERMKKLNRSSSLLLRMFLLSSAGARK
ncbi:MAG: hypothetical protein M3270_03760 [Thermoproteota archaeon]|nr:hypothetical protein [Thermoproteota archaeon]